MGLQERYREQGEEKEEKTRKQEGKVNRDGTGWRGCIRDGLLGSVY